MKEAHEIIREMIVLAKKSYYEMLTRNAKARRGEIKGYIRGALDRYSHRKIDRQPLILPVFVGLS